MKFKFVLILCFFSVIHMISGQKKENCDDSMNLQFGWLYSHWVNSSTDNTTAAPQTILFKKSDTAKIYLLIDTKHMKNVNTHGINFIIYSNGGTNKTVKISLERDIKEVRVQDSDELYVKISPNENMTLIASFRLAKYGQPHSCLSHCYIRHEGSTARQFKDSAIENAKPEILNHTGDLKNNRQTCRHEDDITTTKRNEERKPVQNGDYNNVTENVKRVYQTLKPIDDKMNKKEENMTEPGLRIQESIVIDQQVDIFPKEAIKKVGSNLTVLCKVSRKIYDCRIKLGTATYIVKTNTSDSESNDSVVTYFGKGLQDGECGAYINDIKEEWNGNITCILPPQAGNIEATATMRLVVARSPSEPLLIPETLPIFNEGDTLEMYCEVSNGRPVASITWYLGDVQLLDGVDYRLQSSSVISDKLQTIYQNISLSILSEYNGKILTCKVEHAAWNTPKNLSRLLIVNGKKEEPFKRNMLIGIFTSVILLLCSTMTVLILRIRAKKRLEQSSDGEHETQVQYAQLVLPPSSKGIPKKENNNYVQVIGFMKPK